MSACNLCLKPCECGAEAQAGERLLAAFLAQPLEPCGGIFGDAPRWPELEAMEAALANYAEAE